MAEIKKNTLYEVHKQDRGWGYELWIENLPEYCGKILHIYKDKRGSLHFHLKKLETMLLTSGLVDIRFVDTDTGKEYCVHLCPGDSIKIPRGQPHQIIALEESEIIEFSTTHEETDSYRIQKGD